MVFVVCTTLHLDACAASFPYIAGYAGQADGAAIITRLMDTIQKTAVQIIEPVELRLLGEHPESQETDETLPVPSAAITDRAINGA